jgi:serine protease Do
VIQKINDMKKIILVTFASLIAFQTLSAQTKKEKKEIEEEVIILKDSKKGNSQNMTIEIQDGDVYIDGKKVEGDTKGDGPRVFKKKIIIDGKDVTDDPEFQDFSFPFQGMDMESNDKPMLGVNTKPSKNNDGAEIENVVPGSAAEKFGLKAGDIITKVDEKTILTPKDLVDAIAGYKAGDNVNITFERGNQFLTKNVQLSERKNSMTFNGTMPLDQEEFFRGFGRMFDQGDSPFNSFSSPNNSASPKIGVSVEDRADGDGVMVNEVTEQSAAAKAGIKQGDVITQFGSKSIGNVDELMQAIGENQSKSKVDIEVNRNGQQKNMQLEMPKNLKKRNL